MLQALSVVRVQCPSLPPVHRRDAMKGAEWRRCHGAAWAGPTFVMDALSRSVLKQRCPGKTKVAFRAFPAHVNDPIPRVVPPGGHHKVSGRSFASAAPRRGRVPSCGSSGWAKRAARLIRAQPPSFMTDPDALPTVDAPFRIAPGGLSRAASRYGSSRLGAHGRFKIVGPAPWRVPGPGRRRQGCALP